MKLTAFGTVALVNNMSQKLLIAISTGGVPFLPVLGNKSFCPFGVLVRLMTHLVNALDNPTV